MSNSVQTIKKIMQTIGYSSRSMQISFLMTMMIYTTASLHLVCKDHGSRPTVNISQLVSEIDLEDSSSSPWP